MRALRFQLLPRRAPQSVADYRELAKRALPPVIWAYIEGAAEDGVTFRANREAFARWTLRSRVLTGNTSVDLTTEVGGVPLSFPVLLAPTGGSGTAHHEGEKASARAAESRGTRAIVSTAATYSIEEVAGATLEQHFFQLYPWVDLGSDDPRELAGEFIDRARAAGYAGIVVTVDSPAMGNRESERRLGIRPEVVVTSQRVIRPEVVITPRRIWEAARHPRWTYAYVTRRRTAASNVVSRGGDVKGDGVAPRIRYRMMRPDLVWDDIAWIRDRWEGPLFVKGILDPDDAARAVSIGADGIVVSNHGGRQLDGAAASLDALRAITARVGDGPQLILDGGVRRGSDVVKALCLGATAVAIGRPHLYGLAAAGEDGVAHVLDMLRNEMTLAMMFMGVRSVGDLNPSCLLESPPSALAAAAIGGHP